MAESPYICAFWADFWSFYWDTGHMEGNGDIGLKEGPKGFHFGPRTFWIIFGQGGGKLIFLVFLAQNGRVPLYMCIFGRFLVVLLGYGAYGGKRRHWPQRGSQGLPFWSPDILDNFWSRWGKIDFFGFFGPEMAESPYICAFWADFWSFYWDTGHMEGNGDIGLKEGPKGFHFGPRTFWIIFGQGGGKLIFLVFLAQKWQSPLIYVHFWPIFGRFTGIRGIWRETETLASKRVPRASILVPGHFG